MKSLVSQRNSEATEVSNMNRNIIKMLEHKTLNHNQRVEFKPSLYD